MTIITRIEAVLITVPLKRDYRGSTYSVPQKNAIITRIHTDEGLVGECANGEGRIEAHEAAFAILQHEIAPLLIGADPTRIEHLWATMWPVTMRHSMNPRPAVRAVGCIDSALWDLMGKRCKLPLFRLWGGARESVPIVAIGGQYGEGFTLADYGREMEEYLALGLAGCKFKVGGRTPQEDAQRTASARDAGGEAFILCADANRAWNRYEASDYARRVQHLGLRWFEEPCHWNNDLKDMALLRATCGLPIAAGQSEITAEGCRNLVAEGAVDVCNLDASWGGGPTAWLRVAHMAATFGVQMAHHGEPVVGSHLLAAVPNGTYVETHHPDRDPLFHIGLVDRGAFVDGHYRLTEVPGFGVGYEPAFIAKYEHARLDVRTKS
jgi:D-galactarolactone cycloisomerase